MAFNSAAKVAQEEKELEELLKPRNQPTETVTEETAEEEDDDLSTPTQEKSEEESQKETSEEDGVDWKKRHGDLRRHSQKNEEKLKETIAELTKRVEEVEASKVAASLPASPEELEEWRQENPNAFALVETLAMSIANEKFKEYKKELDDIKEAVTQDKSSLLKEKAFVKITKAHPDYEDLQDDDDFHDWAEAQPSKIKDIVYESTEADEVIWALDMYKLSKGVKPKKDSSQKDLAKAVKTKGNKPAVDTDSQHGKIRESEIQRMSEKEYMQREEEILKAQRSGNIIYDISGGAR